MAVAPGAGFRESALPNHPLQLTWSSFRLGTTPLNGGVVGRMSVVHGKNFVSACALALLAGCAQHQRQQEQLNVPPVPAADPFDTPECRQKETEARRLRVVGEVGPKDVELIRRAVEKVSQHLVVMIRAEPPGF